MDRQHHLPSGLLNNFLLAPSTTGWFGNACLLWTTRVLGIGLLFFWAGMLNLSHAQMVDDPLLKEAERLFIEGRQLARQGKYDRAVAKFMASYRIVPSRQEERYQKIRSTLLFFIGRSYQLQKQYVQAGRFYRRFLQVPSEPRSRELTTGWLQELWPHLRTTLILQGVEGVPCVVEEPRGTKTVKLPTRLDVEAGEVRVTCETEGFEKKVTSLQMEPQREQTLEVVLAPKTKPPIPTVPGDRNLSWVGWIVMATGVAVVGIGGIFGGMSSASRSAGETAIEQAEKTRDASFTRQALQAEKESQQHATTANVMFGVGGGVAILGVILYFVLRPKKISPPLPTASPRARVRMNRRMHSDETRLVSPFSTFSFVVAP